MSHFDVRHMLLKAGVPPFVATMAIPFMFFMPGVTDPDSQPVIEIIRGVQRLLRSLGYRVPVSGVLDRATASTLNRLSPGWQQKAWVVVYEELAQAQLNPGHARQMSLSGMGSYESLSGFTMRSGVAKPSDGPTLGVFQGLQRAINAVNRQRGLRTIAEDGDIGPATLAAYRALVPNSFSSVDSLANSAALATANLASLAGVSINQTPDPARAARVPSGGGGALDTANQAGAAPPGFFDFLKTLPGGEFLPFVALGVGAAYFVVKSKKGKK